eukprot:COSAG06_NODE_20091_length_809_cov_1.228169_2_plen_188_part_00
MKTPGMRATDARSFRATRSSYIRELLLLGRHLVITASRARGAEQAVPPHPQHQHRTTSTAQSTWEYTRMILSTHLLKIIAYLYRPYATTSLTACKFLHRGNTGRGYHCPSCIGVVSAHCHTCHTTLVSPGDMVRSLQRVPSNKFYKKQPHFCTYTQRCWTNYQKLVVMVRAARRWRRRRWWVGGARW